jgi:Domain of unknown function (DUF5615)
MSGTLRFLADEDFDNDIVRGMLRRLPSLDILRAQGVGLSGAIDPRVLEWAAKEGRVLVTHDVSTMTAHAYIRVSNDLPMPGDICSKPIGPHRASDRRPLITGGMQSSRRMGRASALRAVITERREAAVGVGSCLRIYSLSDH